MPDIETCGRCGIPREYYLYSMEPGISNPDYTMLRDCVMGHLWIKHYKQKVVKEV